MNRCETCKHWGSRRGDYDRTGHWSPSPSDVRDCRIITNGNTSLATIDWGSGSGLTELVTHKNFGCVLWEAKDE